MSNYYFLFPILTELYHKLNELPTTEQILQILAMSPDDLEKPENASLKTIQEWYTDCWLPIVVGSEYWDESNCHYKLPTDECSIKKKDGTEEKKVLCTISSEGFGLLVYDNCRDKWQNIFTLKAENPGKFHKICQNSPLNLSNLRVFSLLICTGADIPRRGDAAKPYLAKWTLTKEGQKKYGGWKEAGMDCFGSLQDALEEIRKKDADADRAKQKYCMKIVRALHKIPDDAEDPSTATSKKRSPTQPPPQIDPTKRKVKRRKE